MMNVCVYHGVDLDGYCSAAICARATVGSTSTFVPMNYGWEVPWELFAGNNVVMLDFCLQPWTEMEKLYQVSNSLIWIDHHKSAIAAADASASASIHGLRDVNYAACELTWKWYYPSVAMPRGVFLLGDYDCWRHSDTRTMPYQMGARYMDLRDPKDPLWEEIFRDNDDLFIDIMSYGTTVHEWEKRQSATVVSSGWFPARCFDLWWMAINRGGVNSTLWDSVWDESYDGRLAFHWSAKGYWTVSLYSDKVDCGALAASMGGGGHAGAAGFQFHGDIMTLLERIKDEPGTRGHGGRVGQ